MQDYANDLVLWIGPLLEESELEKLVHNKECATASANLAEWNFLKHLERDTECAIYALSAIRTIEFPKNRKIRYSGEDEKSYFNGRLTLRNVGFVNVFGISHIDRARNLEKAVREFATKVPENQFVHVLVYSMHLPFMKAAALFKRLHPNCAYKLIVPDLPLNMNTSTMLRRALKGIDWKNIERQMGAVDGFVLYTKQMADYLKLKDDQYIVCEGIANIDILSQPPRLETSSDQGCMSFVYAGNLSAKYRIESLVDAFGVANVSNCRLDVYGCGDGEKLVKKACEKYPNTTFHGFLGNSEILEIEKAASLVINPRPIDVDSAEYSCPSKTLEAMALGTPLASSRLQGIPEEYWSYIIPIECDSVGVLKSEIERLAGLDGSYLYSKGDDARRYISQKAEAHIDRMLQFKRNMPTPNSDAN